ncbi:MAG: ThiF family adenylyltransferase [Candidatus Colwellbacteria bacterium]|nr:ThiF family adenylyltransferase [Candidatus Colwellbacteria bacterium]
MNIKLIGAGSVGLFLIHILCRFLMHREEESEVTVIDGDSYEQRNSERQDFEWLGNKAEVTVEALRKKYDKRITFHAKGVFVDEGNVFLFIKEGDVVFLCVGIHDVVKLVSDHCQTLENVMCFSGGNEWSDGSVQCYIRKDGKDVTPPFTYLHPEIENPKDKNPAKLTCEELAATSVPQLIFTNNLTAAWMLALFWSNFFLSKKEEKNWLLPTEQHKKLLSELYFDCRTGNARGISRKEKN